MAVPPARPIDSASSDDRTRESSVRRVRAETLAPRGPARERPGRRQIDREDGRTGGWEERRVMPGGVGTFLGNGHLPRQTMAAEPQPSRSPRKASDCACAGAGGGAFLGWVGELVHRHRGELAGVARAEGLTAEDAFDAVQDAFQTFIRLPAAHPLVDA